MKTLAWCGHGVCGILNKCALRSRPRRAKEVVGRSREIRLGKFELHHKIALRLAFGIRPTVWIVGIAVLCTSVPSMVVAHDPPLVDPVELEHQEDVKPMDGEANQVEGEDEKESTDVLSDEEKDEIAKINSLLQSLSGLEEKIERIEALDPIQLTTLVDELTLNCLVIEKLIQRRGDGFFELDGLNLLSLSTLDPETAVELAAYPGKLNLNGLKQIDDATAVELAEYKGKLLNLGSITQLSEKASIAFADSLCREIVLDGMTEWNPSHAKAFANYRGVLNINGIATIEDDVAAVFEEYQASRIGLNSLTRLSERCAAALAGSKCHIIELNGLIELTAPAASQLAKFPGVVTMTKLSSFDDATAELLCDIDCDLDDIRGILKSYSSVTSIGTGKLRLLDRLMRRMPDFYSWQLRDPGSHYASRAILLGGLAALDSESAEMLTSWAVGGFTLPSIHSLDEPTAKVLSGFKGYKYDRKADPFDPFDPFEGPLADLSDETRKFAILSFPGLRELEIATAESLAEFDGELNLYGLSKIDLELARTLAQFQGNILRLGSPCFDLGGNRLAIGTLDVAVVEALGQFQGEEIHINGFKVAGENAERAIRGLKTEHRLENGVLTSTK